MSPGTRPVGLKVFIRRRAVASFQFALRESAVNRSVSVRHVETEPERRQ